MKNIVFSAGSMGGISFIGAWKALEEHNLSNKIVGFSGCSIGSIMALLTSIGYNSSELKKLIYFLNYEELVDYQILKTFKNLGLDTGDKITELLKNLLYRKTGKKNMTFNEHYKITGRRLWINSSCLEQDKSIYFSVQNSPDLDIITAVRMSISLPWIMSAVKYQGQTYIDGGFHDPCPVHMFPSDEDTLVLQIINNDVINMDNHEFIRYTYHILFSAYRRLHKDLDIILNKYRVIAFDTKLDAIVLDISKEYKKNLIDLGYNKTKSWIIDTY